MTPHEKHCTSKKFFETRKSARRVLRKIKTKNRKSDENINLLSVYKCKFCGFFHLGHMNPDGRSHS